MNRREENIDLWTEAVENQIPNWSFKTSIGAVTSIAVTTGLIWFSVLLTTTDITITELIAGDISIAVFFDLAEFTYYTFSMAIAVSLTRYVWYIRQSPDVIASDIDTLTPSIIIIFSGSVILIFLSVLNSTLGSDVESIIILYFASSYGLLGLLGIYLSTPKYISNNELSKSLDEYEEDLKNPTKDDIIILSGTTNFNAIFTTLILSAILLLLIQIILGEGTLVDIAIGNAQIGQLYSFDNLLYFIISCSMSVFLSILIWYVYLLPDQIAAEIKLQKTLIPILLVGSFLIAVAILISSLITVSDRVSDIYYITSYAVISFTAVAMSSVNFHKEGLSDKLDEFKSDIYEAERKNKNLIQEYERLQSQAPETITVNLAPNELKPSDEVDPEKVVKQNSQIREKVKEYRDKIEKHNEITEGIEEVRSELDNAATLLSDSEFISSSNKIERIESRLTELEVIISEHNFAELEGEINNLQHQKKMLLSDLEENAREYLEDEIESIQSELASVKTQVENNSLTDANERVDDIETKISIAREIATQFNFEDLHKEIESLDRDREAVIKDIGTDMNINVAFSTLRSRLDRAETAIGEGDLKQAADHLSRSEAKLKSVKQSFGDSTDAQEQLSKDFDELVQQHEQQYNNLCSELDDRRRETLEEEKESIQSDIETVRTHLSDGRLTNAIEDLSNIETRINSAQETASQHGFSELQNEIKSLSNTYEQFCEAAEILEKHEEVEDLISAQLDETASLIDDGRITHAYETLTNCRVRIRELKELTEEFEESPAENVVDPTELLGVQLESHYSALEEKEREFVETEIHSIQSELKTIEAHIEKGEFEKAREVIEEVDTVDTLAGQNTERHLTDDPDEQFESRFERVRNIIEQSDVGEVFEDQQETIDTLERRHSELTEKIETLRTLSNEIESLQDELEYIDQTIENNKYDTARENLTEFDNQLHKIEAEVTKYETTPLENKIAILKRRREELLEEIEAAQQQDELKTEISSLRPMLDDVRSLIDDGELEQARDNLTDCEQRIQSLQTSAGEFEKLEKELLSLQDQCEEMLHEVTTLLEKKTVPEKIPQEPDISIVYDELADKQQIGSGGNADVSKAIYQTSDDDITVAIKEPRVSGTLHTADVERVLEEAQTWDKLDSHDHIVGVVDYGSEPLPWIAMEYMDGGHLGEYMDIDLEQKIWTAYAVTEGVLHAHRRGVAHLDLKPENILFRTVENGWNIPKVSDWGLSKHLLDHSKSIEGLTIEYAAPEQFDDEYGATDDFTDIYQLGAVFYELFTGEPLHEGQPFTVMDQIKNEAPTPPSDVSEVPPELDEILMTALAKDKNERYSHVVYLRDALKELVEEF